MMDPAFFVGSAGQLRQGTRQGRAYRYFVPPPLPQTVDYDASLAEALARAERQLGRLSSLGEQLLSPRLLVVPYMRREAVLSSRIEGTQASLTDVLLEESGERPHAPDAKEVLNHIRATEAGVEALAHRDLGVELLRDLHRILMDGVRGGDKSPGEFRAEQNWIGPSGGSIDLASYVPPAVPEMREALVDLERYLAEPPPLPDLIQAGLLHYQFEAIHPFRDGNGRIGRLLVLLHLLKRQALSVPILYLSAFFEQNRARYYEALMGVSERAAYNEWLAFFLDGVATQSEDAVARARRLVTLREGYRIRLQDQNATAASFTLLDFLFGTPIVTIPYAARLLGTNFPKAQRAIEGHLVPAGVLRETTGQSKNRRFEAPEILKAIDV